MYDEIVKLIQLFELPQLVGCGVIVWFFTKDIRSDLQKLTEDFHKMNTRVARLEGSVYGNKIYESVDED